MINHGENLCVYFMLKLLFFNLVGLFLNRGSETEILPIVWEKVIGKLLHLVKEESRKSELRPAWFLFLKTILILYI